MAYIQLSLFGKTSWERFLQMTGWILEPCCNHFPTPKFQCLLLEDGLTPVWCEGERLTCAGGSWMPSIGEEAPGLFNEESESSSWQILEDGVPQKYYLSPVQCSRFLRLAERAGTPPPKEIEQLLLKQGGHYPVVRPFQCFRMRGASKRQEKAAFRNSFGLPTDPFPTLLASDVTPFSFWYEGDPGGGCVRFLTETESERLMGLPEGWTKYGADGGEIRSSCRYQALGNAIALPCADYIMGGIYEVLAGQTGKEG